MDQEYSARVQAEIKAFSDLYDKLGTPDGLHYTCPPCWALVEQHCDRKIKEATGVDDGFHGYVASKIKSHPHNEVHVLNLGRGLWALNLIGFAVAIA